MSAADQQECLTDTLTHAKSAQLSIGAIEEMLSGCPFDHQLSAGLFVTLMRSVQADLYNVVDGLRVLNLPSGRVVQAPMAQSVAVH